MSSGRVSVCLPARDEEATVGPIVATIVRELVEGMGVVDEVVVVDDGSTDATAAVAAAAGAVVVAAGDVLAGVGPGTGKGEALWKSLYVATGDVLVFCDADLRDFDPAFVTGLIGPLALRGDVGFVKGFYERPVGGGRVTELVDVAARFGPGSIAQADLGVRTHRNRPLDELGAQSTAVLRAALARAGVPDRPGWDPADVAERPPMIEIDEYRARRAGLGRVDAAG